jgi:HK97 gp10 family phage protein
MQTKFQVKGLSETLGVFEDLRNQIGDAKKSSGILVKTVKQAMLPVLAMAKSLSPKDTGLLNQSLTIVSRRPTGKDMKSRYVLPTDSAIALVTTKPIPKKLKTAFHAANSNLKGAEYKRARKNYYQEAGSFYDARAIANEFGTAKMSAKPFMRVSLESQKQTVASSLGSILAQNIEKYKAKNL